VSKEESMAAVKEVHRAQQILREAGITSVVAVPADQLSDMYARFLRLNKMGQATIAEWTNMPKEVAFLRHQIFAQSDFGACFAGQWLPLDARDATRQMVMDEQKASHASAL
jgi:hypothetical protein